MLLYLVRRALFSIPVLIGVSIAIFILLRVIPGDPVLAATGSEDGLALSAAQMESLRADLGLDEPLHGQYLIWIRDFIRGDGGESLISHNPTMDNVFKALPVTIEITLTVMVLGIIIAIPIGVLSAVKENSWFDYSARSVSVLGLAIPDFWIGTMLLIYLAVWFQWTVPLGFEHLWENPIKNLQQIGLAVAILTHGLASTTVRFTRSGMLDVLNEDYVRTARAKGLRERSVVMRHALRNVLIPVLSVLGIRTAYLMGGTVIMETLFNLPGLGLLTVDAVRNADYTQVQTNVMIFAIMTVTINFVTDAAYAVVDPRIRLV